MFGYNNDQYRLWNFIYAYGIADTLFLSLRSLRERDG